MEFFAKYSVELIFGLISAGALGFCKYLSAQVKEYKKLLELREDENVSKAIDEKIIPVKNEFDKKIDLILDQVEELRFSTEEIISNLESDIERVGKKEIADMDKIIRSWRFRIIQLCKIYLEQGYLTSEQFNQLSEMYSLYVGLGGNGPVEDYYAQIKRLPIHNHK